LIDAFPDAFASDEYADKFWFFFEDLECLCDIFFTEVLDDLFDLLNWTDLYLPFMGILLLDLLCIL
jgi:hypothetical protein